MVFPAAFTFFTYGVVAFFEPTKAFGTFWRWFLFLSPRAALPHGHLQPGELCPTKEPRSPTSRWTLPCLHDKHS